MAFFQVETKRSEVKNRSVSPEFLRTHQCQVCPRNNQRNLRTPHMEPTGSWRPVIYILGAAPTEEADRKGRPFVGLIERFLKFHIPEGWWDTIRFNNCVRTASEKEADPGYVEIECCRPSVEADIEKTKPKVIFGLGDVPLQWVTGEKSSYLWGGRRIPVKIGSHYCWFYSMGDPATIIEGRRHTPQSTSKLDHDAEFVFHQYLKDALREIDSLPETIPHTRKDALKDIECIDGSGGKRDLRRVEQFLIDCDDARVVGIDYETNRLRSFSDGAKLLTVALSAPELGTLSVALYHSDSRWPKGMVEKVMDLLEDFYYESPCLKVAHNLSFELEWTGFFFGRDSVRATSWGDTNSQAYILDERQGVLSLGALTLQYFGINIKTVTPVDTTDLDNTDLDTVLLYNGVDAKYHCLLYLVQEERIEEDGLQEVYDHQLRRVFTMVLTQLKGVPVDMKVNQDLFTKYDDILHDLELDIADLDVVKKFRKLTGKPFSPSANKDVQTLLTKILGVDAAKTDKMVLKGVDNEFSSLMLKYREAAKIMSTYIKPLRGEDSCVYSDGLLHPVIAVTKTRTWRTSSDGPNIQNWPKRVNKEIRSQVNPGPGMKVVSFDYAGIQARNVAMESHDKNLVEAYWNRYDIHTDWMERIIQLHPKWVKEGLKQFNADKSLMKSYRHRAKNELVFPLFFGSQAKSCARNLGIPLELADELSDEFWDRFSGIRKWQEATRENYNKTGYVTGLSGFRRRAPVAWTEVINTPIQSDEAIIVCDAMNRLSELGEWQYQANLEIHDDLTFIWPAKKVDEYAETVIGMMLDVPFEWARVVPIGVEMSIGDDWAYMEDVGEYSSDEWNGSLKKS